MFPLTVLCMCLSLIYCHRMNCGVTRDYAVAKIEEKNIQTSQAEEELPFKKISPQGQNTDKMGKEVFNSSQWCHQTHFFCSTYAMCTICLCSIKVTVEIAHPFLSTTHTHTQL